MPAAWFHPPHDPPTPRLCFVLFFFFSLKKKIVLSHACSGRGRLGQISSKNRVSDSQAASFAAPFGVPRRRGIASEGGLEGRGRRLLAIRQKKKCIGDFLAPHRQ